MRGMFSHTKPWIFLYWGTQRGPRQHFTIHFHQSPIRPDLVLPSSPASSQECQRFGFPKTEWNESPRLSLSLSLSVWISIKLKIQADVERTVVLISQFWLNKLEDFSLEIIECCFEKGEAVMPFEEMKKNISWSFPIFFIGLRFNPPKVVVS